MATPPPSHRLIGAVLAAVVGVGGCGAPEADRPNVLLLTVDTLRADHLGAWGYPIGTSPNVDRLAARGTRFARTVAAAPETAPAVAALMTGRYQPGNGVRVNGGRIADDVTTLAERASRGGWHTAGIVCNPLLVRDYAFDRGFDDWTEIGRDDGPTDARAADAAITRIESLPEPWLLWVHFMDPHGPYTAADPIRSAEFRYPPGAFGDDPPRRVGRAVELGVIPKGQVIPGLDRLSQYVRRYDGEIHYTDEQIGRVLAALDAGSLRERTLVAFLADHGESLTERDEFLQHGWYVYEPTVHVPFVLAWPGHVPSGRVVDTRASGVDFVPTLAELTGLPTDGARFDGESLAPCLTGACEPTRLVWSLGARDNHPIALYDGDWKLVQTPGLVPPTPTEITLPLEGFPTVERLELYRVKEDPREARDVSNEHSDRTLAMRERVLVQRRALRARGWQFYPGSNLPVRDGAE